MSTGIGTRWTEGGGCVVAAFLGWLLANEPVTPRTLVAAAAIIGAVMVINAAQTKLAAVGD